MNVHVDTGNHAYDVVIASGARRQLPHLLTAPSRVAIIHPDTQAELAAQVSQCIDQPVTLIGVPDGERAKTASVLDSCWQRLAENQFTRSDAVIGLGGGTTTDLAGFVASTWLRGVGYISMPTSVLAMVDAAVGGKTGINLQAGKNLVGAFYEPIGVLCDTDLLSTLPRAEVINGLAEVAKCGFIKDQVILDQLTDDRESCLDVTSREFLDIASRAIQVKADVVSADLYERTSSGAQVGREALNYGHTLGHALEALHDYTMRHGEAISIGMVWMAEVSRQLAGLDDDVAAQHRDLLAALGLPVAPGDQPWQRARQVMSLDKKARGGTLRLVALSALGSPVILDGPDEQTLERAYRAIS